MRSTLQSLVKQHGRLVQESNRFGWRISLRRVADEDVARRIYRASFSSPSHAVSISYEPGNDALLVMVFSRENGLLSDIDDRLATPRLSDLNRRYMAEVTDSERVENESAFEAVAAQDHQERQLVKAAKELRLVLPKYIGGEHR